MLSQQQKDHFHTFGFLFFKGLFTEKEVVGINEEADRLWAEDKARADFKLSDDNSQHTSPFIESTPKLLWIAEDNRVYETATELIGPGMVWANSEGNVTGYGEARWHPDRRNMSSGELDYPRLKVMLYLDEVSADKGALRVIPGSHKNPFHDTLYPMLERQEGDRDWEPIREADDPSTMPYGVAGDQMACHVVESKPGDVLFFNQCLWHAAYNGWGGRRYIALKFAAKPTSKQHVATLRWYSESAFTPHEAFLNSDSERLRGLVQQMAELGKP